MGRKAKRRKQQRQRQIQKEQRKQRQNRHHDVSRSRNGTMQNKNIVWLHADFHEWIHKRFQHRTLYEIADIFYRLARAKENQSNGDVNADTHTKHFRKE